MAPDDYIIEVNEIINCFVDRSYYIVSDGGYPKKTYFITERMSGFTMEEANQLYEIVHNSLNNIGIEVVVSRLQYKNIKSCPLIEETSAETRVDFLLSRLDSSIDQQLIKNCYKEIVQWKDNRAQIAFDSTTAWLKDFPWYKNIRKQFRSVLTGEIDCMNQEFLEELRDMINVINSILQNEKKD